jgi:cell division transport system permease protein
MQLVGVTESFIRRPFLRQGVLQGFFGGLLADLFLVGILYAISKRVPDLVLVQDMTVIVAILIGIIVLGMLLAWFSTRSALDKFLKADLDKLYN